MTECQGEKLEAVKKNTKIKNFQGVKRKEKTGGVIEKVSMYRRSGPFPSCGGELTILRHDATTPSGCACHPSEGGELAGTELTQPPRQAELDTPPQEGN